ncbi:MAG: penicillin-binding transpeptidase domain-containing protein [Phycisphaerales bacterium]
MIRELLPSMFHRRLALLGLLLAAGAGLPAVQMARLATVRGAALREEAEGKLVAERALPTSRGRILDRKGRVLALDRPSYDIAVDYTVLTGQWTFVQAARRARRAAGATWSELSAIEREELIQRQEPEFRARLDDAWGRFCTLGGISREELDARKAAIIERVTKTASGVLERERARRLEAMTRGRAVAADVSTAQIERPIREQRTSHVLLRGVADTVAFGFLEAQGSRAAASGGGAGEERDAALIPGLEVRDASERDYPFETTDVLLDRSRLPLPVASEEPLVVRVEGVAAHVLGAMGRVFSAEDVEARQKAREQRAARGLDLGAYRDGDRAGARGMERAAEYELRGTRGLLTERLDRGTSDRMEPVPGRDVRLTLDVQLQARIQGVLHPSMGLALVQPWHNNQTVDIGTPLPASVVVMDVDTGDILAAVSTPSFTRLQLATTPASILEDEINTPMLNRCVSKPYPPGSIVKPLIWTAAVASGAAAADTHVACNGSLYPDQPDVLRCWVKKQFNTTHNEVLGHDPDAPDALMVSCNIFFYHLGRSLGPERIVEWYGRFGVGPMSELPRLGMGNEFAGFAGNPRDTTRTTPAEAIQMGIGQGPVAWTPLHAADAYCTLARGGLKRPPRLRTDAATTTTDLRLDATAVRMAMEGLRRSVNEERGTGHHVTVPDLLGNPVRQNTFNVPGVVVWGKSGTADAPAVLSEPMEGESVRGVLRDGDHSWFVGMVGPVALGRPKYVIAVVVDYGGSGGRAAGPVANQVVWQLVAEGYL